jgi:hypothetical protein
LKGKKNHIIDSKGIGRKKKPLLEQWIKMLIIYIYGIKLEMVVDVPCKCVQKVIFPVVTHSSSPI